MSRRRRAERRTTTPDPRFNNVELARFINRLMLRGKKTVAQRVAYNAFSIIHEESNREPLEVFQQALRNATPAVGGASQARGRLHHSGAHRTALGTFRGAGHALADQRRPLPQRYAHAPRAGIGIDGRLARRGMGGPS